MRKVLIAIALFVTVFVGAAAFLPKEHKKAPVQEQQLLDATSLDAQGSSPRIPTAIHEAIEAAVYKATLSHKQTLITSAIQGSFELAMPNQEVYSVQQPSENNPLHPTSFFAILTSGHINLVPDQYQSTILRTVKLPEADTDYLVVDSEGGQQGETRRYTRVLSLRDPSMIRVIADIGLTYIDECASGATNSSIVAAKVSYRPAGTVIQVVPFKQYTATCDSPSTFKFIKETTDDVEKVMLASLAQKAQPAQAAAVQPVQQAVHADAGSAAPVETQSQGDLDVGSINCYDQHWFADAAHQNAETRARFAEKLQKVADQSWGTKAVIIGAGLQGDQFLLVASGRDHEQEVEILSARMASPEWKARLCVYGFSKAEFRVMDSGQDTRLIGGFSTDGYEAMSWMKSHPTLY